VGALHSLHKRRDELRRDLRHYCVTVSLDASSSVCASAGEDLPSSLCAVSQFSKPGEQRSHPWVCESHGYCINDRQNAGFNWPQFSVSAIDPLSVIPSATTLREKSLLPARELPFCAGVPAIGVGQDVN
jgi:hypothetical protein